MFKKRNDHEHYEQVQLFNWTQREKDLHPAELKDMVLDNGGDYTETDGYEVGSASDYEIDPQLNLFDNNSQMSIFESPDGGKTVYERKAGDYNNRKKISG